MEIVREYSFCISFREIGSNEHKPDHRLKIQVIYSWDNGCKGVGEVYIERSQQREVILILHGGECSSGTILHELGHVLGLGHTIKRPDRDHYVTVIWDCIEKYFPQDKSQSEMLKKNQVDYFGVPYKCNSIMHYNIQNQNCPDFTAKPGLHCHGQPGKTDIAPPEDWQMINAAHCKGSSSINCAYTD